MTAYWKLGSPAYFVILILWIGIMVGLYFLGKDKSKDWQFNFLYGISVFNFALHFLKLLFPPYVQEFSLYDDLRALRVIGGENICAVNTLLLPWLFKLKNKYANDYLFFVAALGGFLAVIVPVAPYTTRNVFTFDMFRYFFCHMTLVIVPVMMVLYKLHTLDYKRAWAVPFTFFLNFLIIYINENLTYDFGWVQNKRNFSFVYGANEQLNAFGNFFTAVVPEGFKHIPVGSTTGNEVVAPLVWLIFPLLCYIFPYVLLVSCLFNRKAVSEDIHKLGRFIQLSKKKGKKTNEEFKN